MLEKRTVGLGPVKWCPTCHRKHKAREVCQLVFEVDEDGRRTWMHLKAARDA